LGLIYATGQGVPKDFSKARMWWILAGDEEAKQNIVKLEKIMFPEQIQKSELLKKEWHDRHK
jgi:TPR repeat protein